MIISSRVHRCWTHRTLSGRSLIPPHHNSKQKEWISAMRQSSVCRSSLKRYQPVNSSLEWKIKIPKFKINKICTIPLLSPHRLLRCLNTPSSMLKSCSISTIVPSRKSTGRNSFPQLPPMNLKFHKYLFHFTLVHQRCIPLFVGYIAFSCVSLSTNFSLFLKLIRRDFLLELTVLNSLVVWMVVIGVFDVRKGSISIQSYEISNSSSSSVRILDFIALFSWSIKFFLFLFSFTWFDEWVVKLKLSALYYLN